jgi:hypothetical protein
MKQETCSSGGEEEACIDASYGTHNDFKIHTGTVITLGNEPIFMIPDFLTKPVRGQKCNTLRGLLIRVLSFVNV